MKKVLLVAGMAVLAAILVLHGFDAVTGTKSPNSGNTYDGFAKCLSEKGAKMYGASWCPHCISQKGMFGSSWKFMDYVECATPDGEKACSSAGVRAYPTWTFADGMKIEGEMSLEQLAAKTGCK